MRRLCVTVFQSYHATRSEMKPLPKFIEKIAMLFPFIQLILIGASFFSFCISTTFGAGFAVFFFIYLFPLLLWRLLKIWYPIKIGVSHIGIHEQDGNSWIVAHRLQYLFITFPYLERVFIIIPGAFSAWLKLWGSSIGKSVIWTPRVDVVDRTHLIIGDYCFIGDKTYFSSHFIRRKKNRLVLFFKPIKIEAKAIIGYNTLLGPGTVVLANQQISAQSKSMFGRIIPGAEWT